jgi:hypothetical protein
MELKQNWKNLLIKKLNDCIFNQYKHFLNCLMRRINLLFGVKQEQEQKVKVNFFIKLYSLIHFE